jgi:hypothetical protein
MARIDLSPSAITRRLETLNQLSRAAVTLARIGKANGLQRPLTSRERAIVDRCSQTPAAKSLSE